ncbi:NAD(P)H-binding protein [Siphonobacter sp.]|uniref:NAD(P)H-binding protein n=1 Tax=Siphonobacter sp. TaxID=1869184 RepID=UPI003B3B6045
MQIVITGSLGHIGKPLTETLVAQGHSVTVISSNPNKEAAIQTLQATAAIGCLEDAAFLTATFTGKDAVFLMIPPNFTETDQVAYYRRISQNYAEAVRKSGVRRVVHLSSYGADQDRDTGFILGSHHAEGLLNELSEVNLTHLRPGYFYYNLFGFIDLIKTAGFIAANYGGDDVIPLVAPRDIATAAAEELVKPGSPLRYVISDERTAQEIAQVLGKALGKPDLQWLVRSNEHMQQGLEQAGLPPHVIANLVAMGASLHNGVLLEEYLKNKPLTWGSIKLEDFAPEFAAVYNRQH